MGYKKYRLRSRSHVRWRDFKPDGCSLCVFSLWESSRYKSIISMHAKKYILFINTLNLSTRYTYNIHFVFITHREDAWFLCHQMNFDIFSSANSAESELRCNNITVDIKQGCLGKNAKPGRIMISVPDEWTKKNPKVKVLDTLNSVYKRMFDNQYSLLWFGYLRRLDSRVHF